MKRIFAARLTKATPDSDSVRLAVTVTLNATSAGTTATKDFATMDDDDDSFLYGDSREPERPQSLPASVPELPSHENTPPVSNGLSTPPALKVDEDAGAEPEDDQFADGDEEGDADAESDDDDVEIIMEPPARSLDFRNQGSRPPQNRAPSSSYSTPARAPQPSLTTEYTPRERGAVPSTPLKAPTPSQPPSALQVVDHYSILEDVPQLQPQSQPQTQMQKLDDGPDPSTFPPVTAPPSHPGINPNLTGTLDGRSILDVDIDALTEKPWRRPGSDLSDWFNYGFDEISWEAYCYRRRDLGELANVLKTNVLNFAAMPEDQLTALPPEIRTMVMTGANAMMSAGGAIQNPAMLGPMNPMMDMSGMNPMNMGGMGMDIGMVQGGPPMMSEVSGQVISSGTPEQGVQMGMGEGYTNSSGPGPGGMMNMGMGNDFGMQETNPMVQPMYPIMENNAPHTPVPVPAHPVQRSAPPAPYRGRGIGSGPGTRGRVMYMSRGRVPPPIPGRALSPLPPGVPTGPRNLNKYKDRDGNAPAVDGLDYGGMNKDISGRTPSVETEDRGGSRKRRSSPGLDDGRGSKRR